MMSISSRDGCVGCEGPWGPQVDGSDRPETVESRPTRPAWHAYCSPTASRSRRKGTGALVVNVPVTARDS